MENLEDKGLKIRIGNKIIRVKGQFVGSLFCVDRRSIEEHPLLKEREKENLIEQLLCDKSILLSE